MIVCVAEGTDRIANPQGYVLSNSGMDKDTSVYRCSQFLASLKLMTEETYTGNLPVMQRALKLKRDLVVLFCYNVNTHG